ncbi:hypothetical protein SH528x_001200 [Novipirellula sp. SH528]|uniref:hypothetical protein n=1 Tax=Novipirellula sp. SH528 TaxID=3454466 RepID=UPI003FA16CF1
MKGVYRWLVFVLIMQCLGLAGRYYWSTNETESDVYGLLYFDWGWPESIAQRVDDLGTLGCCAAAILVGLTATESLSLPASRPWFRLLVFRVSLAWIFVWTFLLALIFMIRGDVFTELSLGEHAVRYGLPLALLLFSILRTSSAGWWVLRIATAATFIVHGYKAMQLYGPFTDLILLSDAKWSAMQVEQVVAERVLWAIGLIDIAAGVLLIATRWRAVPVYMACWGVITALSRMTAFGVDAWPETLIRAANGGVPFGLVLAATVLAPRGKLMYNRASSPSPPPSEQLA